MNATTLVLAAASLWIPDGVPVCLAPGNQQGLDLKRVGDQHYVLTWVDPRREPFRDIVAMRLDYQGNLDLSWPVDGSPVAALNTGFAIETKLTERYDSGRMLVAWNQATFGSGEFQPAFTAFDASGSRVPGWPAGGVTLCRVGTGGVARPVALSGGSSLLFWHQGAFKEPSVVYSHRISIAGELDPALPPCGQPLSQPAYSFAISTVADSAGAYVGWAEVLASRVHYLRVNEAGAPASGWEFDGRFLDGGVVGDVLYPPEMHSDSRGLFIAWRRPLGSPDPGVYLLRVLRDGETAPGWPENGLRVAASDADSRRISMVPAPDGVWIAWDDGDIHAVRVHSSGSIQDSALVCGADGVQSAPVAVSDDSGGIVVAWLDDRHGVGSGDVFANRILANGDTAAGWAADGLAVCTAPSNATFLRIVADGTGGCVLGWIDGRRGFNERDVYAQRISGDGEVGSTTPPPVTAPTSFALEAPRPNPTDSRASIRFSLPLESLLYFAIFDITGRAVRRHSPRLYEAGHHTFEFDGIDEAGRRLPNGVYYLRASTPAHSLSRKLVVLQ